MYVTACNMHATDATRNTPPSCVPFLIRTLTCQSPVKCCCFSPHKASLAFAGGEDGSVVLWDLREPLAMHKPLGTTEEKGGGGGEGESGGLVWRVPTFSTGEQCIGGSMYLRFSSISAGIPLLNSHVAPVVSISALSVTSRSPGSAADGHAPNLSSSSFASHSSASRASVGGGKAGVEDQEEDLAGLSFQLASLDW